MKFFEGDPWIEPSDITDDVGRPGGICNYLMKVVPDRSFNINDFSSKIIFDTDKGGNFSHLNAMQPFKLVFIPIELVEQYIMSKMIVAAMTEFTNVVSSPKNEDIAERISQSYGARFENEDEYWSKRDITTTSCIMLVFEDHQLKNVYTAIPARKIAQLTRQIAQK